MKKMLRAFQYVKEVIPEVYYVKFPDKDTWLFMDENYNPLDFTGLAIDADLLEVGLDDVFDFNLSQSKHVYEITWTEKMLKEAAR